MTEEIKQKPNYVVYGKLILAPTIQDRIKLIIQLAFRKKVIFEHKGIKGHGEVKFG